MAKSEQEELVVRSSIASGPNPDCMSSNEEGEGGGEAATVSLSEVSRESVAAVKTASSSANSSPGGEISITG